MGKEVKRAAILGSKMVASRPLNKLERRVALRTAVDVARGARLPSALAEDAWELDAAALTHPTRPRLAWTRVSTRGAMLSELTVTQDAAGRARGGGAEETLSRRRRGDDAMSTPTDRNSTPRGAGATSSTRRGRAYSTRSAA